MVPIEGAPGHAHRMAFTIRVPRGVVCGITSFNSPLNFVAHKVAPALASGNTVVVKAPQATPFSAALFCEILLEAGLPPGHVNVVQGPGREVGGWLVADQRIRFYTFTGSTEVGQQLHRDVGLRPDRARARQHRRHDRVRRRRSRSRGGARGELGVPPRRPGVHVDAAALRAERACSTRSSSGSLAATRALKVGDPRDPQTVVGPMISEADAVARRTLGARGRRPGRPARRRRATHAARCCSRPSSSTSRRAMRVMCEEIFAPVVSVIPFDTLDDAIDADQCDRVRTRRRHLHARHQHAP